MTAGPWIGAGPGDSTGSSYATRADLRDLRRDLERDDEQMEQRMNVRFDDLASRGQVRLTQLFAFVGAVGTAVSAVVLIVGKG